MLSQQNRMSRAMVEEVFKRGRFINRQFLSLRFLLYNQESSSRVAFIVSKSVSKSSPTRHLLRRRGYVLLRKHFGFLPEGFRGVVTFRSGSVEVFGGRKNKNRNPIEALEAELLFVLKKL